MMFRLIALCALVPSTALAAWEEVADDDGITVWVQEVKDSSIREVKASAIVEVPATRIWTVLNEVDKYVQFMPYLIEAKILERSGNTELQYQLVDPPFVDRRDYVLKVTMEADEKLGIYKRHWTVADGGKGPAPREDAVRLNVVKGHWTIEKLTDTQTRITYYLYTDPGGNIPNWIANKANKTSVPDLLDAVRKRAANPSYKRS